MTTIKLKNGSGAPTAGDLVQGEPALDLTNKRLYTEDSGGTVIEVGTNPGTDVTFADNRKAIFGAGSDLQIVHDGSNSYISELGSGDLILQTNGAKIGIAKATPFEWMLEAETDGAVSLYHDNSKKLATTSTGIDVTGSVTADDSMLVEGASGSTLTLKNTTTGAGQGVLIGTVDFFNSDTSGEGPSVQARIKAVTANAIGNGADLQFFTTDASGGSEGDPPVQRMEIDQLGDISFYNDAGTSQDFYWDASTSRLGLGAGATTPSATLDVGGELLVTGGGSGTILVNDEDSALCPTMTFTRNGAGTTTNAFIKFENSGGQVAAINAFGGAYFTANVGIGTDSTFGKLSINSNGAPATSGNMTTGLTVHNSTGGTAINIGTNDAGAYNYIQSAYVNSAGTARNLAFFAGATRAVDIDTSGNVGIGTTSPLTICELEDVQAQLTIDSTGSSFSRVVHQHNGTSLWTTGTRSASDYHIYRESGSGNVIVDAGNFGIGTTNAPYKLVVSNGGASSIEIEPAYSGTANLVQHYNRSGAAYVDAVNIAGQHRFAIGGTEAMRIDSSGQLGVGTTSPRYNAEVSSSSNTFLQIASTSTSALTGLLFGDTSNAVGRVTYDHSNNSVAFFTNTTEKARIDSSGNLLVGKSVASTTTAGGEINADGTLVGVRDGGNPLVLNRLTSDGTIASFRKDGSTIGLLDAYLGYLKVYGGSGSSGSGLWFGSGAMYPVGATNTVVDNVMDIGHSSYRFQDIYASNGTIQTSDRNEKQDIEKLSDAEQRVAVACKGLLRKFRWKSAVEEKGDDARIHFGIIAQDLQDAFTAEGLDAGRYGMFINSTWTDEETGEERSRMGVRYSELLAFIISAI